MTVEATHCRRYLGNIRRINVYLSPAIVRGNGALWQGQTKSLFNSLNEFIPQAILLLKHLAGRYYEFHLWSNVIVEAIAILEISPHRSVEPNRKGWSVLREAHAHSVLG